MSAADFLFQADQDSIRRQLRLEEGEEIPAKITPEYEKRIRMKHGDGATGPLGSDNIMNMLCHLGITPNKAKASDPKEQVDWSQIPEGTRVLVKSVDHKDKGILKGVFKHSYGSGFLAITCPILEPSLQQFMAKEVSLDRGQLTELEKPANKDDAAWEDVLMGTPISVTLEDGKVVEGMLGDLGPGAERLTILVNDAKGDQATQIVKRSQAKVIIAETAKI